MTGLSARLRRSRDPAGRLADCCPGCSLSSSGRRWHGSPCFARESRSGDR